MLTHIVLVYILDISPTQYRLDQRIIAETKNDITSVFYCVYHDFFYETDVNTLVNTDYRRKNKIHDLADKWDSCYKYD